MYIWTIISFLIRAQFISVHSFPFHFKITPPPPIPLLRPVPLSSAAVAPPLPLLHFPFLLLPLNPRRNSPFPLNPRRHSSHLLSTRDGHSPPEPAAAQLHFRLLSTPVAVIHPQNLRRQPFTHHQPQPRPAPPNQQETLQEHVLERIGKSHYLIFLLLYNFCLGLLNFICI
ncbi:hypothetical protein ACJIZ3_013313 [Penstemon smallii]|uniref:Uncharacterized protein n=1 Tax=Penstemon smallii TaxID=265156 RepID=A0ABD3URK6_9LAMI